MRPILRKNCTVCHSERRLDELDVSAGLALDQYELIRKPTKSKVLVPGKPDESLLVTLLTTQDKKRAMPLDDFIRETLEKLAAGEEEAIVDRVLPVRDNPGRNEHGLVNQFNQAMVENPIPVH